MKRKTVNTDVVRVMEFERADKTGGQVGQQNVLVQQQLVAKTSNVFFIK